MSPGISVHVYATLNGYVSAGTDAITGTYGPSIDPFLTSAAGTFVFRVLGQASGTPGGTSLVNIGIRTYTGYGPTYVSGAGSDTLFSITTAGP